MPRSERTAQGEQYLIPGAERRTVPGLPYAAEPDGQLALHFYEPPGEGERSGCRVDGAPRPAREQRLSAAAGLFGAKLAYFPQVFGQQPPDDRSPEAERPAPSRSALALRAEP